MSFFLAIVREYHFLNIYNNSFWPVVISGNKRITSPNVLYAISTMDSLDRAFEAYENDEYDFEFFSRFLETSSRLRSKEAKCDVKIQDYIEKMHRKIILFMTQNHPTTPVFIECARQIRDVMAQRGIVQKRDFDLSSLFFNAPINLTNLPGYWPIDHYSLRFFKFEWRMRSDETAPAFYRMCITDIWYAWHPPNG